MKINPRICSLSAFILTLLLCVAGFGQSPAPRRLFSQIQFHKLKPGHTFREALAIESEWQKFHQLQADEGTIEGWYLLSSYLTSNPVKEYNYITVTSFSNFAHLDDAYPTSVRKKVLGDDYRTKMDDLYKRASEVKEVAKVEIWEVTDVVFDPQVTLPSKFPIWVMDVMKVRDNKFAEYVAYEGKMKPIQQERVNLGNIVGWNFGRLLYPAANEKGYQYGTVNFYPSMNELADTKYREAFEKAMPGQDTQAMINEQNATRDWVRQEIYTLQDFAVKTPATTVQVDPKVLDNYTGVYEGPFGDDPKATFTVTREGNRLYEELTGGEKLEVVARSNTRFAFARMDAQIEFIRDKSGRITGRTLTYHNQTSAAKKIK